MSNARVWGSMLSGLLVLGACGDDGDANTTDVATSNATAPTGDESSGGGTEYTFSDDIEPILTANCVMGCHEPGGNWPSFDLSAGVAYDNMIDGDGLETMSVDDVKMVVPGDTANSFLLLKLRGTQASVIDEGLAGAQMPIDDMQIPIPLPAASIDIVEDWIAGGAPE